jgi:hypothetical protein
MVFINATFSNAYKAYISYYLIVVLHKILHIASRLNVDSYAYDVCECRVLCYACLTMVKA